jgi:Metalloenzyme superfamily
MKKLLTIIACILLLKTNAQDTDQKFIIITSDGLRWQEVFKGMDSLIGVDKRFNQNDSAGLFKRYWDNDLSVRRKLLMPFFWSTVQSSGQLYGNRRWGNKMDNANPYWFSYPGYSELLTGQVDTLINSNDFPPNPYENVLEHFNKKPNYKNKVAAFASWNAFDRILNERRSGFPVVNAFDDNKIALENPSMKLIHEMVMNGFKPFGSSEILDVFTHYQAFAYLKEKKPKAFYISYGDTDEWAHHGDYKFYLEAIHQFDKWVNEIWNFVQSDPFYKDKTTILITTDHGRGDSKKEDWTSHGQSIPDAHETWSAWMGPKVKPLGEIKAPLQHYQKQLVPTLVRLIGGEFAPAHAVSTPIDLPIRN